MLFTHKALRLSFDAPRDFFPMNLAAQSRQRWGAALLLVLVASSAMAGDWPQILGPNRNGIAADDERLAEQWPQDGPPVRWERPVGSGYAGVAVAGRRVILFHRERGLEVAEAVDALTGETLWEDGTSTDFYPQVGGGDGPLCVPTVVGDRVVTYGAQGELVCRDLSTGASQWSRQTHREFGAPEGYFGAGSSPIVVGEKVIVNVGGSRQNAGVVAFDLKTGETLWKQTNEPASYSSPVEVNVSQIPHVLMVTRYKCLLLDADKGAIRFQFPFGQRGPTVNGASPLVLGDHLLVSSAYGIGSVYASFDLLGMKQVWEDERLLATQYCTPVHHDGLLYAIDGRDDLPPADLKCVDPQNRKLIWVETDFGYGTLILADNKLLILKTTGELLLVRPSPDTFDVLDRARIFRRTTRALPALSQGRLFVRDERTLKCLDLAP